MRGAKSKRPQASALLIGADGTREAIASILDLQGLRTEAFECVDDIPGRDTDRKSSLVVLWVEDTSPALLAQQLQTLTLRFECTPVVAVCAEIQRSGMRSALSNGASGVVLYDELDVALGPCVQAVLAGQTCVPRAYTRQIEPPVLSSREKQVLGLVVLGYTNGQIAEQLFLAQSTVKSHLSSAFAKLGVRSRNEAVSLILDPERGLGTGILALGGEPLELASTTAL